MSVAPDQVVLFDGTSTQGWTQSGPGGFALVGGVLESRGGMGLLWYAARSFDDFLLELDWQVDEPGDNSGVFVRFPDPADDPFVAVHHGYEIQIDDLGAPDGRPTSLTGAIYSFQGPTQVASRPPGEWNRYAIRVEGQRYTVALNDVVVNTYTGSRERSGYVGLQNHGPADTVRFRDVRLTPLTP